MAPDLVQRLRTCSTEERRAVAREVAQLGTDDAVSELKKMVESEIRDYTPRTLGTFWRKLPINYSGDDIYLGIEALGETRSIDALDYLKGLIKVKQVEGKLYKICRGDDLPCDFTFDVVRYPNAKGELAIALNYSGGVRQEGCSSCGHFGNKDNSDMALTKINSAIEKLEKRQVGAINHSSSVPR